METIVLNFEQFHKELQEITRHSLADNNYQAIVDHCKSKLQNVPAGTENEIKAIVDTTFKQILQKQVSDCSTNDELLNHCQLLLNLAFEVAARDICSRSMPVLLLTDMFELSTLSDCEHLFTLVEDRVSTWKEEAFFKHVKNQLLRTCNDLLRRLSRSQNTVFCGRILVFLARFFPLFERSGLNLISEFNPENVITIALQDDGVLDSQTTATAAGTDLEEGEMPTTEVVQVDYNMYKKFWKLQDMFRAPNVCYNKATWKLFQSYSNDVLSVFQQHKLDPQATSTQNKPNSNTVFFSKYLTNQKLLELQLSDSNFRRYILVQFLITFQYLVAVVRFKQEAQALTDEQTEWVSESVKKVFKLLEETPPNGVEFRMSIENILSREENWNAWKNDGCTELKPNEKVEVKAPPAKKRRIGDEQRSSGRINIGSAELSRLWNLCPDNFDACRAQQRLFTPSIETFFSNVIHASESERQKEFQRDDFSWRALRLLSQKSPHFFLPSNQMVKPLTEYLNTAMEKLSKDLAAEANKVVTDLSISDAEDISDDELLKQSDEVSEVHENGEVANGIAETVAVTPELLVQVAEAAKSSWKQLAMTLFNFCSDELEFFESSHDNPLDQAKMMLQIWSEQDEPENVTVEKIANGLDKCGISFKLSPSSTST